MWVTKVFSFRSSGVQGLRPGFPLGRGQTVGAADRRREMLILVLPFRGVWTIHAMLDAGSPAFRSTKLIQTQGRDIPVSNQDSADKIVAAVRRPNCKSPAVAQKERGAILLRLSRLPKLQQGATTAALHRPSANHSLSQKRYEGRGAW